LAGIKEGSTVHLALVDEEHLLVFNGNKRQLFLLKFDSDVWQFKLSSQVNVGRDFDFGSKLLLDELDKRKFILSNWGPGSLAGSVVEDTIVIDRQFSLRNVQYSSIKKYVGSKLFSFQRQNQSCELVEWNLNTLERTLTDRVPSILDSGESIGLNTGGSVLDHVWHEDWIYVAAEYPIKLTKIYAFSWESKRWFDTNITVMGRSTGMFIDENNVLVLKAREDEDRGINNFYRFPLKKPESLMNLAWLVISRQSTVFGNKLFDKFADRLPYTCELRSLLPDE